MIAVEVAYALPAQQIIISLCVPPTSTVQTAIELSGILTQFPEINLNHNKVGIFGQLVALSQTVQAGDRIEIYRPLLIDPKQARFLRVRKKK